jgi:hypothetical protein
VNDRHGDAGTVLGDRPVASFDVLLRPVVAQHGLLAQEDALAGREVDVVDPQRDDE